MKPNYLLIAIIILVGTYIATTNRYTDKYFPPALIINLPERTDRIKHIKDTFSSWPGTIDRINAVRFKPGWIGCSKSHQKAVNIAKKANFPWILVIEDDCHLRSGAIDRFNKLLPFLWNNWNKWDIFLGGPTYIKSSKLVDAERQIYEVKGYTAHFTLINSRVYDKILNMDANNNKIDVFYSDNMKIWTSIPYMAFQLPGTSDIENSTTDYTKIFMESENNVIQFSM